MQRLVLIVCLFLSACTTKVTSDHVWLTSEAGDKCAEQEAVVFKRCGDTGQSDQGCFVVDIDDRRQTIDGFGNSITESSAFVLACLDPKARREVLEEMYGEHGANFSMSRTVVGSSDFAVEGKYSYDDVTGDKELKHFSLDVHRNGFSKDEYPQIKDENYDVWQCLHEIADVKGLNEWRIIASPWSAPAWMKDHGLFYDNVNRNGGALLEEYYDAYARYFVKYLDAYRKSGIEFWAITPENEPMGNDGSWESMHLTPKAEAKLIGKYLGPQLEKDGFGDVKILCFDQNTFEAAPYTAAVYGDSLANHYTDGTALHWYGSTISCFPEILDSLHTMHPTKRLLHTEGCIDNLGRGGWPGVSDYEGYKESGWFRNDAFWWNDNATDWAYSTPWWPEWHPKYTPVHRYASYIIDGLNHWLTGFIDWNAVLDSVGEPTHVHNTCGAMLMVDYANDVLYYTPYYYVFKQFSRSMRPGDVVLGVKKENIKMDNIHLCATQSIDGSIAVNILNTGEAITYPLQIGEYVATVYMQPNCVKTIIVKL